MSFTIISLVLLALGSLIAAEGDNCDGSMCKSFSNPSQLTSLDLAINQTTDTQIFRNGQNIACINGYAGNEIDGGICVWFWNTQNTSTGADAKQLYPYIRRRCSLCGSVPSDIWSNDVSSGELTIGWSPGSYCDGVCNQFGGSTYVPGDVVPNAGLGASSPPAEVPSN